MTSCEALVPPFTIVNNILTNNSTLQVNSTQTGVGEVVKLSCLYDYTLLAESDVVKCLPTGKWSFSTKPTCAAPVITTPLSEEQKIILGVAGGVGGLVLIFLIIMLCLIFRAKRHSNKKAKQGAVSSTATPRADILGDPIDTYPQRFPYPDPVDIKSHDSKRGYGNPAFLYDGRRDFVDPRKDYLRDIHLDTHFGERLPSADYDNEYFGDYPDDPLPDPPEFRANPDLLRADPESKPYRLTNAVRMYEDYGRPARVRMLEEAYDLQRPYRRPSENFNYALKAVTTRSSDVEGLRGDDPTRFYRGFYH